MILAQNQFVDLIDNLNFPESLSEIKEYEQTDNKIEFIALFEDHITENILNKYLGYKIGIKDLRDFENLKIGITINNLKFFDQSEAKISLELN